MGDFNDAGKRCPEVWQNIKQALIGLLHGVRPEWDVICEEIPKTKNDPPGKSLEDYFFLDLIPRFRTAGPTQTEYTIMVDIAAHEKAERNAKYMELAAEIDQAVRPAFRFEDRAITVHSADVKIVDRVLHYAFTLTFLHGFEETPTQPSMSELITQIKKE